MDIVALFQFLQPHVTTTTLLQCSRMAWAMLVMTGRVTMLGISRWAGKGGSSRTVQRFFATVIPWATLFGVFFRHHVYHPGEVYLLVGDEVVATKAGKHTDGLDRFFASLYGKPGPGLAFFTLSLVRIAPRHSFPIRVEQVGRSDAEKAASKAKAQAKKSLVLRPKRRPGRQPGSTNKTKTHVTLPPELVRLKAMIDALLHLLMQLCPLPYLVLDGHFGTHNALHMARQCALPLIAKLRCDAALSFPSTGP
jgi:putative transposase